MILNPAIIALVTSSLLISLYGLYASWFGIQVIRHWDILSGSERQLSLERRTYLISTVMTHLCAWSLLTTFLLIYTADHLHPLFTGAMCAAGSLNANAWGFPLIIAKVINFFLCGQWLILNYVDGLGEDYPLIKTKYRFLAVITVLLVVETVLTVRYFGMLRVGVITSCCGTLFSVSADRVASDLAALPPFHTNVLLYSGAVLLIFNGIRLLMTGKGGLIYGGISVVLLVFGLAAVISVISVYYYQLPTHHCPFDILQSDYHWIGYPLYAALFTGGMAGSAIALIDRFKYRSSLKCAVPLVQKRLCCWSMLGYVAFMGISAYPMIFTEFKIGGY